MNIFHLISLFIRMYSSVSLLLNATSLFEQLFFWNIALSRKIFWSLKHTREGIEKLNAFHKFVFNLEKQNFFLLLLVFSTPARFERSWAALAPAWFQIYFYKKSIYGNNHSNSLVFHSCEKHKTRNCIFYSLEKAATDVLTEFYDKWQIDDKKDTSLQKIYGYGAHAVVACATFILL